MLIFHLFFDNHVVNDSCCRIRSSHGSTQLQDLMKNLMVKLVNDRALLVSMSVLFEMSRYITGS